ncbi:Crp/Fnr family transcriptional regulator [Methylobacterium sp. J-030]|uniref:Crp/Fnr family transcriptional regulator n=1 Tax=Methylobacterium sp. J-030 TaxID=2836627 RepID=UPI001FBB520D|nr:Crp/Fnr family transcriptional regulator [Methylobacterium sp. J-030]MCJ2069355.1 Crp/Fnr family transcriptional regulator [Methylobacterium sp. J-030]
MPPPEPTSTAQVPPAGNLLLDALDDADRGLVAPHCERAEVRRGDVLFRVGDDVGHVTFPLGRTVISFVVPLRDGKSVETATVGHEGAIGGVVSQGYLPAFSQAVIQVGGTVMRIEAERLNAAKDASPAVRDLFVRYADCLIAQLLQSAACNAVHPIEQRCLRWLLTLQDRIGPGDLPVTHDQLAEMMGVRRAYLSEVLGRMQRDGLVRTGRGRLSLVDRPRAEATACECYASVRHHFSDVLGAIYARSGTLVALDPSRSNNLKPPAVGEAVMRRPGAKQPAGRGSGR